MPSFLNLKSKFSNSGSEAPPPDWAPAPETSHQWGSMNEASNDSYESALDFCAAHPPQPPRLLSSEIVDRINTLGCRAWSIEYPDNPRFLGSIHNPGDTKSSEAIVRVQTTEDCEDICLLSDIPILAGLYDIQGKRGVYYEVEIIHMDIDKGASIAVGTSCRPYPTWRLPGWNRLSGALHLDDMRKFFEDSDGGRDYLPASRSITARPGDIIGCGYEFESASLFFTYNGMRLPPAFTGVYLPRASHDVYVAVGISGSVELKVNFGGQLLRWKEGNEWAWRVEGHVGRLGGGPDDDGELPSYSEANQARFM